jgi:hypothetical protein
VHHWRVIAQKTVDLRLSQHLAPGANLSLAKERRRSGTLFLETMPLLLVLQVREAGPLQCPSDPLWIVWQSSELHDLPKSVLRALVHVFIAHDVDAETWGFDPA